ncbi:MAG: Holliday junction branch migration protein RuvA [Eubacterium sp.]|nr:Holliday junction branch migration protein RuvA [Eubacterium sp.]MCM1216111.1 Holliday junction branch migration protein RuvA [Lachnospiraceae bacterium]MCM1305046.1 Holliday junction branch migration protein RuvA [Butyrivibrio sp.]MCM1343240.1 Holliday junction branch migration protein RuvA [Muribaculaceae bacterium]MCM1239117.1 Holliday junction branch migration protein RuvA [Lachnospiraceae bacterium]
MIAYVNGIIEEITEDNAVIDVGGIGYNVRISSDTASRLPGVGEPVKLYTYTSVREDAFVLYGFLTRSDLEIFKKLITVNGIGPKGGLSILSVMDADDLRFAIMSGDSKAISRAPGIGAKTAQRVILDLKDKIEIDDAMIHKEIGSYGADPMAADSAQKQEAVAALVSLGYGQAESLKAVNSIEGIDEMDSGAILKAALKKMF